MSITKTGKKKLFRMTVKRKIIMSEIISTLNIRLESVDEQGFSRLLVLHNNQLSEEKRNEKLIDLDKQLQELSLLHDVLEVVSCHEEDWLLNIHMKEQRGWRNEWDVPLDVFNESIDKVIELLRWFQNSNVVQMSIKRYKQYDRNIKFLLELKKFRNEN